MHMCIWHLLNADTLRHVLVPAFICSDGSENNTPRREEGGGGGGGGEADDASRASGATKASLIEKLRRLGDYRNAIL